MHLQEVNALVMDLRSAAEPVYSLVNIEIFVDDKFIDALNGFTKRVTESACSCDQPR